ncbi:MULTISPECIES: hypothetical protein [Bacillus cereus group]
MDITKTIARMTIDGKEISFISVGTSAWDNGPVNDLIVSTKERIREYYTLLWSQQTVAIVIHFLRGAVQVKFAKVIGITDDPTGEYIYHFYWG